MQHPELVAVNARLGHVRKKIESTEKLMERVQKDRDPRANSLKELKKDLERANKAFEAHKGMSDLPSYYSEG